MIPKLKKCKAWYGILTCLLAGLCVLAELALLQSLWASMKVGR